MGQRGTVNSNRYLRRSGRFSTHECCPQELCRCHHCAGLFFVIPAALITRTGSLQCGFCFVAEETERMGLQAKLAIQIAKGPRDYKRVVASRNCGNTTLSLPFSVGGSEPRRVLNISLQAARLQKNRRLIR